MEDGSMLKRRPSALSTAGLAAIAILGALLPRPAVATPTFIQGVAFSTPRIPSTTVTLTHPVAQGDLLVGWFSQYNAPGEIQVSDNVNGTWTRVAAGALTFDDDTGDIALYYRENSRAAPGGITIAVSASASAYLGGAVADYSGVALAGSLARVAAAPLRAHRPRCHQRGLDTGRPLMVAIQRQRRRLCRVPRRFRHRDGRARQHDLPGPGCHAIHHPHVFGRRLRPRERSFGAVGTPHDHHAGRVTRIRPGSGSLARLPLHVPDPDPDRALSR